MRRSNKLSISTKSDQKDFFFGMKVMILSFIVPLSYMILGFALVVMYENNEDLYESKIYSLDDLFEASINLRQQMPELQQIRQGNETLLSC